MPKFAANLTMLFTEMPFLDRFEAAHKNGFSAVEFLFPYAWPADEIKALLDTNKLADLVPDFAERETWACGPGGMLDALEGHYGDHGLEDQIHTERFRPSVVVAGDGGQVTFSGSKTVVEADGATPLLDVGEEAGVLMPSGCRMGICFGCVAPLREGAVRDLRSGDLTTATLGDDVRIQTCVSAAAGTCDIDL